MLTIVGFDPNFWLAISGISILANERYTRFGWWFPQFFGGVSGVNHQFFGWSFLRTVWQSHIHHQLLLLQATSAAQLLPLTTAIVLGKSLKLGHVKPSAADKSFPRIRSWTTCRSSWEDWWAKPQCQHNSLPVAFVFFFPSPPFGFNASIHPSTPSCLSTMSIFFGSATLEMSMGSSRMWPPGSTTRPVAFRHFCGQNPIGTIKGFIPLASPISSHQFYPSHPSLGLW